MSGDARPPRIPTEWGDVSEPARLQAACNMREDHTLRERVMRLLMLRISMVERDAWREMRRRYPEAFAYDETEGMEKA